MQACDSSTTSAGPSLLVAYLSASTTTTATNSFAISNTLVAKDSQHCNR